MMKTEVVVTRHPGLLEVLVEKGIATAETPVVSHEAAEDIRGKHVAGVLPLALAAECASVTEISLNIPAELRGKELSADQVRQFFAGVHVFTVRDITPKPATNVVWNDKSGNRSRRNFLILADSNRKLHAFDGRPIPGVCKCRALESVQDGKWSNSTWEIRLEEGCREVWRGLPDFETFRLTNCKSWAELASTWGVTEKECRQFVPTISKRTAEFLSALE